MAYIVITGASSGIGKELAYSFAKRKYNLLLIARREDLLKKISVTIKKLYAVQVDILIYDITDKNNRDKIISHIQKKKYSIKAFINNAGFGGVGMFFDMDIETQQSMIDLNISALVYFTHKILPILECFSAEDNEAYIMNVGSVAGFMPGPYMTNYYATKAFVVSFTESLSEECKKNKRYIIPSVLCPGPIGTEFSRVAHFANNTSLLGRIFSKKEKKSLNVSKVAEYAVVQMFKNKRIIIPGMFKVVIFLFRFLPRTVVSRIMEIIQRQRI